MLGKIKRFIKKIIYGHRADDATYLQALRNGGAKIGERVRIFDPHSTTIDLTRPWMVNIGNDVQITAGVTILTHGYDWSVLKGLYGNVLGSCGEVVIGDNCFVGMHTTILKGVHIGKNCIIGANSLVNRDIPEGWVAAGNPARLIMPVTDYLQKRQDAQMQEAQELYRCYVERMHKEPPIEVFDEFYWLFQEREEEKLLPGQKKKMQLVGNYEQSLQLFMNTKPLYAGYPAFLDALRKSIKNRNIL